MIFSAVMFGCLILTMIIQEFFTKVGFQSGENVLELFICVPWAFFYVLALAVPYPVMLFFALCSGFMWDARWQLALDEPHFAFGTTCVMFAVFGSFMQGIRPLFRRGHWFLPVVMVGICVLFQMIAEYGLMSFKAGDFFFSGEIWFKMVLAALAAMIMAPLMLVFISRVAKKCGYQLEFEQFMFRRAYGHQI